MNKQLWQIHDIWLKFEVWLYLYLEWTVQTEWLHAEMSCMFD